MNKLIKFKSTIENEIISGGSKKNQAIRYLRSIDTFKSIDDFKVVIQTMIEIDEYQKYYNMEILDLIQKTFIKQDFTNSQVIDFVRDLFLNIELGTKYDFYYTLYKLFKNDPSYEFPITEKELKKICLSRLQKFVDQNLSDLQKCYNLYYLCREKVNEKDEVILQKESHLIMRRYISDHPWEYIESLIRPYMTPIYRNFEPRFTIEPFTKMTFDGWNNFWDFIEELKEDPNKPSDLPFKSIYNFLERFKDKNYKPILVFENEWRNYGINYLIKKGNWNVV